MNPALLLVDLQHDFLSRDGIRPSRQDIIEQARILLDGCRALGIPILHVRTVVQQDGSDRMPHWKRDGLMACLQGTRGAEAPQPLSAEPGEPVFAKQFFSAFGARGLEEHLKERGIDTLIVAGLYTHSCVRATVLDAYQRGLEVWIARDAIGSTDPVHAELSLCYLGERAALLLRTVEILTKLAPASASAPAEPRMPVGFVGEAWFEAEGTVRQYVHRDPMDLSVVRSVVPFASAELVTRACIEAERASWKMRATSNAERRECLLLFAAILDRESARLAQLLAEEIAKPITLCRDEIARAAGHVRSAAALISQLAERPIEGSGLRVRHRPRGVIAAITPWNNPIAIPAAKLAPALAFGNAVVWKPSPLAPRAALATLECLAEAGFAKGVQLLFGDGEVAEQLIADRRVGAVSLTGSTDAGRCAAALCARANKPLQAELGGNNAAVFLRGSDLESEMPKLVRATFAFAGQRCTAIRRFIVEASLLEPFSELLGQAMSSMSIGDPRLESTLVGPMITGERRDRLCAKIESAEREGAKLLFRAAEPAQSASGAWFSPIVVGGLSATSELAQEESFGPVSLLLPACDEEDAIAILNAAPQGLLATVSAGAPASCERVLNRADCGLLQLGSDPLAVHADAPFGGWKASGLGPPEHGRWDLEHFARVQAIYRAAS